MKDGRKIGDKKGSGSKGERRRPKLARREKNIVEENELSLLPCHTHVLCHLIEDSSKILPLVLSICYHVLTSHTTTSP